MPDIETLLLDELPALVRRGLEKLEARVNEAEASGNPNAENLRAILTGVRELEATVRLELRSNAKKDADDDANSRDFYFNQKEGVLDVSDRPFTAPIGWITLRRDHLDALMAYGSGKSSSSGKTGAGARRLGRPLTRSIVDAVSGLNKVLKLSLTGFPSVDDDVEALVRLGLEAKGSEFDVAITVAYDTLEKLSARQLTPPQAFMMGLFKIDGDLNIFMQLAALATTG